MYPIRAARFCPWFLVLGTLASATASLAQTLDAEVTRLLDLNCTELGVFGGNPNFPGALGPNLNAICLDNNAAPVGSASGGGGASSQATDTLLGKRGVTGRLEEEHEEDGAASRVQRITSLFDVPGLGLWLGADYTDRERDVTTFEDGYQADVFGASLGVDYRLAPSAFAGIAYNFQRIDADFEGGGGFETDSHGVVVYGSLTPTPEVFVDASIGYAFKDYEVDRFAEFIERNQSTKDITLRVTGIAESDTDGGEFSAKLATGYDHTMGAVTVGPRAGVNFAHTSIDGAREKGSTGIELIYSDRERQSLQSALGAALSAAAPMGFGVLIPEFDVEWIHEFQDFQRHTSVRFVEDLRSTPTVFSFQNESPDRDFFHLGAGASLVLANGIQVFANYRTTLGHSDFENSGVAVGVRLELGGTR